MWLREEVRQMGERRVWQVCSTSVDLIVVLVQHHPYGLSFQLI